MRFLTTISPTNHPSWNRIFEEEYNIYIYTHLQQGPFLYCPLTLITNNSLYVTMFFCSNCMFFLKIIRRLLEKSFKKCRVVDLSLNQAAKPWFHQYLDPLETHLWRLVSETKPRGHTCNLGKIIGYWKNPS